MDSNTVTISIASPYSISNVTYIENSLVVSAGQDPNSAPPTPAKNGNVWTITLDADRSGTPDVAQSFNAKVGGASHEYVSSSWSANSPGTLNFYFGVNLSIGTETITVYLGQGNWGALHHNWWFGSRALILASFVLPGEQPAVLSFGPQIVIDGTQFSLQGTGDSSFNLAKWPPTFIP